MDWNIMVSILSLIVAIVAISIACYFQKKNEKQNREHQEELGKQSLLLAALNEQNELIRSMINNSQVNISDQIGDLKSAVNLVNTTIKKAQNMIPPKIRMTDDEMAEFSKEIIERPGGKVDAKKLKRLDAKAWEEFLEMAIEDASLWATPDKGRSKWKGVVRKPHDKGNRKKSEPLD
jgi:hypothetical protein